MKCTDAVYRNGLNTAVTPKKTLCRGWLPLSTSPYTSPAAEDGRSGCLLLCGGDGEHTEGKYKTLT